jgi:hypothetical protein
MDELAELAENRKRMYGFSSNVLPLVEAIIVQQSINSAKCLNGLKESFLDFLNF